MFSLSCCGIVSPLKRSTPQGGPIREVQSRILKDPSYEVRDMRSLIRILIEQQLFPFAQFWVEPILGIYKLEDLQDVTAIALKDPPRSQLLRNHAQRRVGNNGKKE